MNSTRGNEVSEGKNWNFFLLAMLVDVITDLEMNKIPTGLKISLNLALCKKLSAFEHRYA